MIPVVSLCLPIAVMVAVFSFRLQRIELTSDAMIMHTLLKNSVLPVRDLEFVRVLPSEEWGQGLIRTFGYGYPLPLYGKFYSKSLGSVMIYSVRMPDQLALLLFHGRKMLVQISPEELERLKAASPSRAIVSK